MRLEEFFNTLKVSGKVNNLSRIDCDTLEIRSELYNVTNLDRILKFHLKYHKDLLNANVSLLNRLITYDGSKEELELMFDNLYNLLDTMQRLELRDARRIIEDIDIRVRWYKLEKNVIGINNMINKFKRYEVALGEKIKLNGRYYTVMFIHDGGFTLIDVDTRNVIQKGFDRLGILKNDKIICNDAVKMTDPNDIKLILESFKKGGW